MIYIPREASGTQFHFWAFFPISTSFQLGAQLSNVESPPQSVWINKNIKQAQKQQETSGISFSIFLMTFLNFFRMIKSLY